ncbi:biotin transporter BioY [Bartonella sp. HY329]|uniref:biotin transporter BioY n=1 Tax=unclassified Bartonella TaxID=2645622 RepID=UPI0021CAB29C|nr:MULTISPECIES: biotin transporter BioY [unclassified Bartonella]UXM94987.1 biotin transporter BioY [Bartonella sp. HY329]UXN09310.1 biotin transporter BioY [Bartonella sp. HY328]
MTIKDVVLIALMAAFIIVLGFIPAFTIPFIPVPITTQSLGVMLAGALLGVKRGVCAILIIWILVAVGLPILSGGRGGLGVFMGATAGYFVGWAFGAAVIGFLFNLFRNNITPVKEIIALILGGIFTVYFFGIVWLYFWSRIMAINTTLWQIILANLAFIPIDLVKVAIVFGILKVLHKALPGQFGSDAAKKIDDWKKIFD